jgi:hypothetical protein
MQLMQLSRRLACIGVAVWVALGAAAGANAQSPDSGASDDDIAVPAALRGPFIADSAVVTLLDCTGTCTASLHFTKLILARAASVNGDQTEGNPFNLSVLNNGILKGNVKEEGVLKTVEADLRGLQEKADNPDGLDKRFLVASGSEVELVGIVNRMDHQFVKDSGQHHTKNQLACGEISLIYRFAYKAQSSDKQGSRLPVTMNLVFPALPTNTRNGTVTCQGIAQRWLEEINRPAGRTAGQIAADLMDPAKGPLAFIDGRDIDRLELNMQAYRIGAVGDATRFGTKAAYLIRVFRWNREEKRFTVSYLGNQIDRDRLLCTGPADPKCAEKQRLRRALVDYLQRPAVVSSIDAGTLDLPLDLGVPGEERRNDVLARRAISISPGGSHRSGNQPYWGADHLVDEIITNDEITEALKGARNDGRTLSTIQSVRDFRTRLNDMTCTGCHQTRAIAGFHFPGSDRKGTPLANSVFLPGSSHFFGDQPRRMEILQRMAMDPAPLKEFELATSYAARPLDKFAKNLESTQLIGGWGGACLLEADMKGSQRQWTCKTPELTCVQLFKSQNDPGIGTCVPGDRQEVGDALQRGRVITRAFGDDRYARELPDSPDERIPPSALPKDNPPNSWYGAHQEGYPGKKDDLTSTDRVIRRDALTGGFPAGMLRLSECVGLPAEATCGLTASNGFTKCINKVKVDPDLSINDCFATFTSFAGLRACDAASPCRDDYICVRPMGYTAANAKDLYKARFAKLKASSLFEEINERPYDPEDFGQMEPDTGWISRNGRRGLCIPPYFVFQFRSDGHPSPQ